MHRFLKTVVFRQVLLNTGLFHIPGAIWIRPDKLNALVACRGWSVGHVKS